MSILPFPCDVPGCNKSKLRKHTHFLGEMRNFGDQARIEQYRWYAEMTGQPMHIPGGSSEDMSHYMSNRVKQNSKIAKEFRKKVSQELEAQKKQKQKPDKARAEASAKAYIKKKFGK